MSEAYYDGDCGVFCDNCAPAGAETMGDGEADYPMHCDECGRPLDYSMTEEGVKYAINEMKETLKTGRKEYLKASQCLKYYKGCPQVDITRDWAGDLIWYNLPDEQERFIKKFLSWTEYQIEKELRK